MPGDKSMHKKMNSRTWIIIFVFTLISFLVQKNLGLSPNVNFLFFGFYNYACALIIGLIYTFQQNEKDKTIKSNLFTDNPISYFLFICPVLGAIIYAFALIPLVILVEGIIPMFK